MGDRFLIVVETSETTVFSDTLCLDHISTFTVTSASPGVEVEEGEYANYITTTINGDHRYGAAIVEFSDLVLFQYLPTKAVQWDGLLLPIEKFGTEYFVVFPRISDGIYVCIVDSIANGTAIKDSIMDINNISSQVISYRSLDVFERILIEKSYDFTGSRILASKNVSVRCSYRHQNQSTLYQLLPAEMFGRSFHYQFWASDKHDTRLITPSINTTINISSSYNTTSDFAGETFDVAYTDELPNIITFNKPVCVWLDSTIVDSTKYITPVEQYLRRPYFVSSSLSGFLQLYLVPGIITSNISLFVGSSLSSDITFIETFAIRNTNTENIGHAIRRPNTENIAVINFTVPGMRYLYVHSTIPVAGELFVPSEHGALLVTTGSGRRLFKVMYFDVLSVLAI